jgi:hypothetical protein
MLLIIDELNNQICQLSESINHMNRSPRFVKQHTFFMEDSLHCSGIEEKIRREIHEFNLAELLILSASRSLLELFLSRMVISI